MNAKSRSKQTRARHPLRPDHLDWRDAMDNHCQHLETLAELLKTCGQLLEPEVAAGAGYWLGEQVEAIQALLDEREAAR
jgi:hypothetical protein